MNTLKELEERIQTIEKRDWEKLFALIPQIEQAVSFGEVKGGKEKEKGTFTMPFMVPAPVVNDFFSAVHELAVVPVFDWVHWEEGRQWIRDPETDYSKLTTVDLCKLFTVIIRTDRFNEGFLVRCFEKGMILKILKALQKKVYSN